MTPTASLWHWLWLGYLLTVILEFPVLWFGLHPRHSRFVRCFAATWLTACTYPIVVLVLTPLLMPHVSRVHYLLIAETFAPAAECLLFRLAFGESGKPGIARDFLVVVLANLTSFTVGEFLLLQW